MIGQREKVAIIGVGRLGAALSQALHKNHYPIVNLIDYDLLRAKQIASIVGVENYSDTIFKLANPDIIFISIPDDEIDVVVSDLKIHFGRKEEIPKFVFHTSGALSSDVFKPLKELNISCGSFHPIQAFSGGKDDWKKFQGCYFGVEGDSVAIEKATQIINILNGHKIIIHSEVKPIYHLACTMASNYMVSLMIPIVELFKKMDFSEQETLTVLAPLISTTLANIQNQGIGGALTGPISRGDIGTIKKHLEILTIKFPIYKSIYQQLGKFLLNLKAVHDKIPIDKYEDIMKILNEQRI